MSADRFDRVPLTRARGAGASHAEGASPAPRPYRAPQLVPAGSAVRLLQGWYSGQYDGARYGLVKIW